MNFLNKNLKNVITQFSGTKKNICDKSITGDMVAKLYKLSCSRGNKLDIYLKVGNKYKKATKKVIKDVIMKSKKKTQKVDSTKKRGGSKRSRKTRYDGGNRNRK